MKKEKRIENKKKFEIVIFVYMEFVFVHIFFKSWQIAAILAPAVLIYLLINAERKDRKRKVKRGCVYKFTFSYVFIFFWASFFYFLWLKSAVDGGLAYLLIGAMFFLIMLYEEYFSKKRDKNGFFED